MAKDRPEFEYGSLDDFARQAELRIADKQPQYAGFTADELGIGFRVVQRLISPILTLDQLKDSCLILGEQKVLADEIVAQKATEVSRDIPHAPLTNWLRHHFSSEARERRRQVTLESKLETERVHTLTAAGSTCSREGWCIVHPTRKSFPAFKLIARDNNLLFLNNGDAIKFTRGKYRDHYSNGTVSYPYYRYGISIQEYKRTDGTRVPMLKVPLRNYEDEWWLLNTDPNSGLHNDIVGFTKAVKDSETGILKSTTHFLQIRRVQTRAVAYEALFMEPVTKQTSKEEKKSDSTSE